jgi:hypothetical protein
MISVNILLILVYYLQRARTPVSDRSKKFWGYYNTAGQKAKKEIPGPTFPSLSMERAKTDGFTFSLKNSRH